MRNLEIKATVRNPRALARRVAGLRARLASDERQTDTYFHVTSGRLKLRERSGGRAELIFYERPEASAKRVSNYDLYRVNDPGRLKKFLARSLGIRVIVAKRRVVYLFQNARIHLDTVRGLGRFAEIEVMITRGERQARALMSELLRRLEIDAGDLIQSSYSEMLIATRVWSKLRGESR